MPHSLSWVTVGWWLKLGIRFPRQSCQSSPPTRIRIQRSVWYQKMRRRGSWCDGGSRQRRKIGKHHNIVLDRQGYRRLGGVLGKAEIPWKGMDRGGNEHALNDHPGRGFYVLYYSESRFAIMRWKETKKFENFQRHVMVTGLMLGSSLWILSIGATGWTLQGKHFKKTRSLFAFSWSPGEEYHLRIHFIHKNWTNSYLHNYLIDWPGNFPVGLAPSIFISEVWVSRYYWDLKYDSLWITPWSKLNSVKSNRWNGKYLRTHASLCPDSKCD